MLSYKVASIHWIRKSVFITGLEGLNRWSIKTGKSYPIFHKPSHISFLQNSLITCTLRAIAFWMLKSWTLSRTWINRFRIIGSRLRTTRISSVWIPPPNLVVFYQILPNSHRNDTVNFSLTHWFKATSLRANRLAKLTSELYVWAVDV